MAIEDFDQVTIAPAKLRPFSKFIMSIGELPTSYLDSLSYAEQVTWFCDYLQNQVIPALNNNATALEEVQNLYNELVDYLNNIDVQEEIDNKLDQMVEDGTLDIIVQRNLALYDEYNFHTLFATEYYRQSNVMSGMQGGCVLPDNTIIQCTGNKAGETGKLLHYGNDGTLLNSVNVNYGHCNGVTYCDKTDTVFITSTQNETLGLYMIYEIDPETLEEISSQDLSSKNFPGVPYGLAYIKEDESFVFINYWWSKQSNKFIWKTDLNFNVTQSKQINLNFRSTSNLGRFGNYLGVNTISSNKVMLFNPTSLDLFKEVSINELVSDTWFITEVEWFDTRNDKIYLGFIPAAATSPVTWGGGTKVIAYFDNNINYQETGRQNSEFPPCQEVYYVDSTVALNPLRDGSSNAPFRNIYEALNSSLRTQNVTGDVSIFIVNNEVNTYKPIFTMNKSYRIYRMFEGNSTYMSAIAVGECSKVYFDGYIQLQAGELIDIYNWGDCHIQNRGTLICNSYIADSGNNRLIIGSSSSSYTSFALNNNGIDITNMFGEYFNIRTDIQNSAVIYPVITTQENVMTRKVRNVLCELTASENKYQIPLISNIAFVKIRFNLPNGSNRLLREETLTYTIGQYQDYAFAYLDSSNNPQAFHIIISASGEISFTSTNNISDVTQLRVRWLSY